MKSYPQPTHATKPALSTWKISWTDYASRKNYAQAIFWKSVTTRRTENGTPHAEPTTCTTLFADRNRRLEIMLPNALHRQLRTESAAESPGDQSGPNKQSGLTQCDLQQKADSAVVSPRGEDVCALQALDDSRKRSRRRPPLIHSRGS